MPEIILILAIVWLVVTVCGHLSWVMVASVFKALFGEPSQFPAQKACPRCGRISLVNGRCTICDFVPLVSVDKKTRDELQGTAKQLARLQRAGHLPYDQCVALLKVIEHDLARLGETISPEVWKLLDLRALPASEVARSPASSEPIAESGSVDAPVLDALVIEAAPADRVSAAEASQPATLPADADISPPIVHPLGTPSLVIPPLEAPPLAKLAPSRTLADMLQGFMEESNIRWGEVIAGLVIVISAIGLVISLRATLQHIPYFPALLFMLFTVAFHGAGLYTLRRWNLAAVSRAILIIALLLVPLSFSAAVVLSGQGETQRPVTDPLLINAVVIGLAVFGWVSFSGSRVLVGEGAPRLTVAILGACFAQIVINRGAATGISPRAISALALFPVAAYLIAAIGQIFRAQAWQRMSSRRIEQTFLILGVSLFALVPPLALLVFKVEPRWQTFVQLAPLLSLVATSVLALGLVVHLRAVARMLAPLRTAGTAIALLGGALIIFCGVIVWPRPELMLNVSLLTGALLLAIAIRTRLPALHGAAIGALAMAAFIAFAWWQKLIFADGTLGIQWLQAALYGRSSLFLTALAAVVAGVGAWWFQQRQQTVGLAYLVAAGVLGGLSLLSAGWSGFATVAEPWAGDDDISGPLFLCYGIALLAIAIVLTSEYVLAAGMALLWVALIQLLWRNETAQAILTSLHLSPERPVLVATILEALVLAGLAFGLSKPNRQQLAEFLWLPTTDRPANPLMVPLTYGAAIAIAAATPFILWVAPGRFNVHALYALLAALVWGIVCVARRWPAALAALQAMAAVATAFVIAGAIAPSDKDPLWFARGGHLQAQLLALAATAAVWSIIRRFTRAGTVLHQLLHPEFAACDHALLGLGVSLLLVLSLSSAIPGMHWELGFGTKEISIQDIAWLDQANRVRLAWGFAAIAGALVIALADRISGLKLVGLALTGWAGLFLLAQRWEGEFATASAARWLLGLYGCGLMLLFVFGGKLQGALKSLPVLRWQPFEPQEREWFRFQPLLLGVLPVLVLTIIAVAQNASGVALRGPVADSIFLRFGTTALYAGPLLLGVLVFLGLALGQRQSAFALGGGALFQLAANLAFILHISGKPLEVAEARWAEGLQWNALAASLYAVIWCALSPFLLPRDPALGELRLKRDQCFLVQVGVSVWLLLTIAVWAAAGIIRFPDTLATESKYLGHWSNVISVGLLALPLCAALGLSRQRRSWASAATALALLASAVVPILALRLEQSVQPGAWLAYHATEIGWLVVAAMIAVAYAIQEWNSRTAAIKPEQRTQAFAPHHALAAALCALVAGLALRGNARDPELYSPIMMAGVTAVLVGLGWARRSQPYAIAALAAGPLAAALPWFTRGFSPWFAFGDPTVFLLFVCSATSAAIVIGAWWQALEIRLQQRDNETFSPRWRGPLAGHLAIAAAIVTLALASLFYLVLTALEGREQYPVGGAALLGTWLALGFVALLSLWDRRATLIFPALFAWLWIGCTLGLAFIPLERQVLAIFSFHALATAGLFALAGHLWRYGVNLAAWGEKLGVSDTVGGLQRVERWLPTLTILATIGICGFELLGMFNLPLREHRVAIALAPGLLAYAVACQAQQGRRASFRLGAMLLGGLCCVYLGWSDLQPGWELSEWMTRAFRLLMVLGVVTLGYGLVLPRFILSEAGWLAAAQRAGYVSSALALTTFACLLALEVALFEPGVGAGVDGLQVAAVAVLLVVFIAGLISLAVAPGITNIADDRRRGWFVYGAQLVAGLLFAHLYLCKPDWFDGFLKPYWPYIVMAIAFAGVGLGELFWRLRLPVLAEPFQRTGAFLPVLPILGLWIWGVDNPRDYDHTLLLFFAGLMYLILSVVRKSWPAAIAATVAGNGALWALLDQSGWSIFQHPQFWVIPPAISVLLAAHINRDRLKPEWLSGVRYGMLVVIYVSSTGEIFLHQAENFLWPPMVLALLSLTGAFLGVLLQIRAFLYLGAVFTLLAMVSMVWHAARAIDHVWPWWLFGIGMGIAILTLLALFEKNRPQVQALVLRLRQWDQ